MSSSANIKVTLSVVDYSVLAVVLLASALVGVYYAWKSRRTTTRDYLTGGRKNSVLPVSFSLVASMVSSVAVLGIPAEVFSHSIQYWVSNVGAILGVLVTDQVFVPIFYPLQLTSVNKYLMKRFDYPALRFVSSLSFIFSNVLMSAVVVYGPALAISSVTPMSLTTSIIAVGLVCTFYTTVGGMKAVIWTDVLQLAIMVSGMLMVAIQGTIQAGGTARVWSTAVEGNLVQTFNWSFDTTFGAPTIWETMLGMVVLWAGLYCTNQMCVQRYCSLPTIKKAKWCMYVSIPFMAAFYGVSCYCGVAIFANYFRCDPLLQGHVSKPDALMPYFVVNSLGHVPGLSGLFIAAVFSGSLSTLSSSLNSMTILTWDDFLKKLCKVSSKVEILVTKAIAMTFGLATMGLAFLAERMGSVLDMALQLTGAIVGPQLGTFFLGALCPFANGKSVMISFVFGQACCMALNVYTVVVGRPHRRLPTYTDQCDADNATSQSFWNDTATDNLSPHKSDQLAVNPLLYISPFFMPFLGFAITFVAGVLLSLLTGGRDMEYLDPAYLSPQVRKFVRNKRDNNCSNGVVKASTISLVGLDGAHGEAGILNTQLHI